MTAGRNLLKPFTWSLRSKKRDRSGSGGSADLKENRKKSGSSLPSKSRRLARKTLSESLETGTGSSLEIVAPASSDVEFKYSWPINSFIHQVKTGGRAEGLDSKQFEVNVNGIHTTWSLSVRFWVGENGEKLSNPFVLCLNLVNCKVERNQEVRVKYRFGIYNRSTEEPEMGAPERVTLKQETIDKLQSVGYKNIAMNEKHVNSAGDILLFVRLSIIREEEANHSLSSDLKSLINDEKSSDLILEAGERKFLVHKNILAARSPVFADLLARMDTTMEDSDADTDNPESAADKLAEDVSAKLVPIQESSHSNTSRDIRLLEELDRKLENITETEDENEEVLENQQTKEEKSESLNNKTSISKDPKIFTVGIAEDKINKQSDEDIKAVVPTLVEDITVAATQIQDANGVTSTHVDSLTKTTTLVGDSTLETTHIESLTLATKPVLECSTVSTTHIDSLALATKPVLECSTVTKARVDGSSVDLNDKDLSSVASDKELVRKDSREEMFQLNRRKDSQDRRKLVIDDLPGDTVEQLLKYIYTDSSHNVESFSQTLLAASDKYKLPGLKQHCEKHLVEILSPVNVSDILLLSASYGCKDLKKAALAYCGDNHSYIMKDSKWKTIEMENPDLFEEAISLVAPDSCNKHLECLKKGGNRYEAEKTTTKGNLGLTGRKKSSVTRKL